MIRAILVSVPLAALLTGCAIDASSLTASAALVSSLAQAGCKGTVHIAGSATTAAMGVPSATLSNTFDGSCDPSTVVPAKPAS